MPKVILAHHCTGKSRYIREVNAAGGKALELKHKALIVSDVVSVLNNGWDVVVEASVEAGEILSAQGIEYYLVYQDPTISKQQYLPALTRSGRRLKEIHDILKTWVEDINTLQGLTGCIHIKLGANEFIADKVGAV
jgi:hypothetical protein